MKLHRTVLLHTLLHYLVGLLIFLGLEYYANFIDKQDPVSFYSIGYISCIVFFGGILPMFVPKELKKKIQNNEYILGTFLILFLNLFIPLAAFLSAAYWFDLIFNLKQ